MDRSELQTAANSYKESARWQRNIAAHYREGAENADRLATRLLREAAMLEKEIDSMPETT